MNIQERIRQIMLSEELSDAEKLNSLYSLLPTDACKIDNLTQATPAQLRQLKDGLAVPQTMQQLRAELFRNQPDSSRIRQRSNISSAGFDPLLVHRLLCFRQRQL